MVKESKIFIFEAGKEEGIFSENKKFYPSYFTKSDIKEQFLLTKKKVADKYNFDDKKVFQAYQKTEKNQLDYPDGKYTVITEELIKDDDCWYTLIPTDIYILPKTTKGVTVGNQMADCPILIVEDREKEVTALSHCGASYIDRKLPVQTVEALIKEYNSNIDDLYIYVGSCAKKETYIYDRYPLWAKDLELWKDNIVEIEDGFHIDMNGAIRKQLEEIGIKHIEESPIDTIIDDRYYSHRAASLGNKEKLGQNFVGFYYK